MKQFKNYPIHVNYNTFDDDERAAALAKRTKRFYGSAEARKYALELAAAAKKYGSAYDHKPFELAEETKRIDGRREEIKKDPNSTGAWEDSVIAHLEKILATDIGKLFISSMNPKVKVYIVVDSSPFGAAASTTPDVLSDEQGGGVRLYFDPYGFKNDCAESYTAPDVLFHELVHAYRSGWKGIKGTSWRKMKDYDTAEEFLAIQMHNVFMHQFGKSKFYVSHSDTQVAGVKEVYKKIANTPEAMEVLAYYLYLEPTCKIVAKWSSPPCNVWRDYKVLYDMSPHKKKIPPVPRIF